MSTLPENHRQAMLSSTSERTVRAYLWIEKHQEDDTITMREHIQPLVALANAGDAQAYITLGILGMFNQQEWLHDRMTFHALADVQEWASLHGIAQEVA